MATIYLALGSNIACRLTHLRQATDKLMQVPSLSILRFSPIYQSQALMKIDTPSEWNHIFFNCVLCCDYHGTPDELLTQCKAIEKALNRRIVNVWGAPRTIDIDILAWDDCVISKPHLTIPHNDILNRSFVLKPLLDIHPDWQHPTQAHLHLTTLVEDLTCKHPLERLPFRLHSPHLVGVLNVTPDSFSDGGNFNNVEKARRHCIKLAAEGADVIDIGAESTAPHNPNLVSPQTEWQRLSPILEACFDALDHASLLYRPKISIDTRHLETIEKVLSQFPIDWINDQEGNQLNDKIALLKNTETRYVCMHHCGLPPRKDQLIQGNPVATLLQFFKEKIEILVKLGLTLPQIICDVGIGFGKNAEQIKLILTALKQFSDLPTDCLIGHSRKMFINSIHPLPPSERDLETAIISSLLPSLAYQYLRVHDVESVRRALSVKDWFYAPAFNVKPTTSSEPNASPGKSIDNKSTCQTS